MARSAVAWRQTTEIAGKIILLRAAFDIDQPDEPRSDQIDLPAVPSNSICDRGQAWEKEHMTLRRLFRSIIALTVAAGLLSAPLAATAFAKPDAPVGGEMHAMSHAMDMEATDAQAMAGDMSCCPDEGKAGDCASCPLLALCMLSISIPLPAAAALVTRDPLREAFSTRDDAWVQGLAAHPPDHPPRTMI